MDLSQLYSLRTDFTIIGLTGRTGSGCTMISKMLTSDFEDLKKDGLRDPLDSNNFDDPVFQSKYRISYNYLAHPNNWSKFDCINYKDVLLFIILKKIGKKRIILKELFLKHFNESTNGYTDNNKNDVTNLYKEIELILDSKTHEKILNLIYSISKKPVKLFNTPNNLKLLNKIFFSDEFSILSKDFFDALEKYGYFRRTLFLHYISCNLRSFGKLKEQKTSDIKYIYTIAEVLNRLIKARKFYNNHNNKKETKIVIDSLRNSLEIMFFKERYSGFYLIATKDVLGNSRERVKDRLNAKYSPKDVDKITNQLMILDKTEYKIGDFNDGQFSSPDVENCIQKSDYHIINLKLTDLNNPKFQKNTFFSREEQLVKLLSLIMQPGIITPSSVERCMQIANTAKLNSGCISRKVGAVITDGNYVVRSIGWNDVAKGQTPCNLRNVEDFFPKTENLNNQHYSNFERGENLSEDIDFKYKYNNKGPSTFKEALLESFNNYDKTKLEGKNCSFCFKKIHNDFEKQKNQVHTRSLHAEENAMLQITKSGGIGVSNGILFTTASPCELCSKKAYQLGISKIFYIDPYPGIAEDQILKSGIASPSVYIFSGAVGSVYNRLYETFLSYKDEMSLTLK